MKKSLPQLAKEKYCTGCLACRDICAHKAIDIVTINGLTHPKVNPVNCVGCKLCENTCPIVTPVRKNDIRDMKVFGGWCTDDNLRIKAASGGAFTGIALGFFNRFEKAAIVGASLKENNVKHIIITDRRNIRELMNSKYIQSDTNGIFKQVLLKLKEDYAVLFSGTPCQIAGLYGYLGNRHFNKLYTVEIVCHGIPGREAVDIHLQYFNSTVIYSFRDKKEGQYWYNSQRTTIDISGKSTKIARSEDIFYHIFSGWMLDRKSCSNCLYSSINRVADITLADFWGANCNPDEFQKGVSLIISNNSRGNELIQGGEQSSIHTFDSSLSIAINGNPNLYDGYKFIQYHPIVMFPDFFRKFPKLRFAIITNQMPWKLLWGVYKILTNIHHKYTKQSVIKEYHLK